MELKLETLRQPKDILSLESMLETRLPETQLITISLEKIEEINLSTFNALIKLYMKVGRLDKQMSYVKCHSEKLKSLIIKTQLTNVFCTK